MWPPGGGCTTPFDVVRLAALGHLGRSGANVGQLGPQVAALELRPGGDVDYLAVLAPELSLEVVPPTNCAPASPSPAATGCSTPHPFGGSWG